jgi:hypothetical protein
MGAWARAGGGASVDICKRWYELAEQVHTRSTNSISNTQPSHPQNSHPRTLYPTHDPLEPRPMGVKPAAMQMAYVPLDIVDVVHARVAAKQRNGERTKWRPVGVC